MTLVHWIIPIRLVDLLEIALVAYVLYKLYQLMRGTLAVQIFLGVMAIYLLQVIVTALDMTMLRRFFSALSEVAVLAVIILFQPEIRRLLVMVAQTPFLRRFVAAPVREEVINEVCAAVAEMSRLRIGGLIAFERSTGLRHYIETGTILNARISRELLLTIFYDKNPLHDGAVIIRNQVIAAARCILPVSTSMKLSPHLGLRHRAAVGLTEQTDAFVVVVSEETGTISVAQQGELISNLTAAELRTLLIEALEARPAVEAEEETSVNLQS